MPSFVEASVPQNVEAMMPKKRQQGFDLGPSSTTPSSGTDFFPSPATNATNHLFSNFGASSLASSFIDTDILLNDDLWNHFSPSGGQPVPDSTMQLDKHDSSQQHYSGSIPVKSNETEKGLGGSFVNIPHTHSLDFFASINTDRPTHDAVSRLSKDTSSMDDGDSPDGSNGETTSTVATSVVSPSSHGTMASSVPKSNGGRHHRTASNASATSRPKSSRSLSRSRNRAAADASGRRAAERSPSLERGGVGKAPTSSSRARASRRATVGPAAVANGNVPIVQGRITSPSANAAVPGLSSSFQSSTNHRWSMFGAAESSFDHTSNLHLNLNNDHTGSSFWGASSQGDHRPGTASASSSLPTPLSFHTSMQHLHLQTPPVQGPYGNLPGRLPKNGAEEDSSKNQPFNPFLFPPYTQAPPDSEDNRAPSTSVHFSDGSAAQNTPSKSSEASELVAESKPPAPPKARRPSKVTSQTSREKLSKDLKANAHANSIASDAKAASPDDQDQDDDEDALDDEDDQQPLANGANKSEAEAKRLAEKRRRRRESHNAVERRRRDNINEKITELATLLPEAMLLDAIATSTQGGNSGAFAPALAAKAALAAAAAAAAKGETVTDMSSGHDGPKTSTAAYAAALAPVHANSAALAAAQAKPNKGIILRKSVEYIRHLQQFLDMQMGRIGFLEAELQRCHQVMASSGMQAPPPSDPHHGLSMMNAFMNEASGGTGFFGADQSHQALHQHQQQPITDFSAMNLLSLGLPTEAQPQHQDHSFQASQPQQNGPTQQPAAMSQSSSGSRDGPPPALAAWLEGFDQRTGLPRRSSVDPIEEEEHEDGEADKELIRRGRSTSSRLSHDTPEEDWRGRSRQKHGSSRKSIQEGSWPDLGVSEAQSPMQLIGGKDDFHTASFSDLGDIKMEM